MLDRSHAAFAEWRATTAEERASILERVADAYDDRSRELGELIAAEMGKPLQQSIGKAELAASIYRWYATHGPDLLPTRAAGPAGSTGITGADRADRPPRRRDALELPLLPGGALRRPEPDGGQHDHPEACGDLRRLSLEVMAQILHEAGVPRDAYANVFASHDQIAD